MFARGRLPGHQLPQAERDDGAAAAAAVRGLQLLADEILYI